jgi:hypothetical protein
MYARAEAPNAIAVVDDLNDRVMLFRVTDGAYVGDLLTAASAELGSPVDCQLVRGVRLGTVTYPEVLLLSDSRQSRVVAYDATNGAFLGPILSTSARGLALNADGRLAVATYSDGVRSAAANGSAPATLVAPEPVLGPHDAWDVLVRSGPGDGDLLVSDATLDAILRFSLAGERLGVFAQRPEFRFIEQLAERRNGNVLAADVFGNAVHEFAADGAWLHAWPVTRPRGLVELRNGNILVAAEEGVLELDGTTGALRSVRMPGYPVSAPRYATYLRCRPAELSGDLNGDAIVNFFDIDPFLLALLEPAAYAAAFPALDATCAGDVDGDGELNFFDIDPFVALLVP